jgi:cytochrome c peroxidase
MTKPLPLLLLFIVMLCLTAGPAFAADPALDHQLPREDWLLPFKDQQPIFFVARGANAGEWDKLAKFWNEISEKTIDPKTGTEVERKVVKIKVPLGLQQPPPIPVENPPTVAKWKLGKKLYFDPIVSSDGKVSCASCHDPSRGFTDQSKVSVGISGQLGGVSAPTVLNSAYHVNQFWDGRAGSLEEQCQGPPQNPIEMFDGKGDAWNLVVQRVRAKPDYTRQFREAFGTEPTRDSIAKAIATYERTVLSGNSIDDRAQVAMRERVADEGGKLEVQPKDFETVLKEAVEKKDTAALKPLGIDAAKPAGLADTAKSIHNGRVLFFNKARCSNCHVGDNFTDNGFHNLGVGVKDGVLPKGKEGRIAAQPVGHKNPELMGAFKTPTLRALLSTAPYLHDGSEDTLEKVVDFYDKGGNVNRHLDQKMRDLEAEKKFEIARQKGTASRPDHLQLFDADAKAVAPFKLSLTDQEKKDLVIYMKALQGDPPDAVLLAN